MMWSISSKEKLPHEGPLPIFNKKDSFSEQGQKHHQQQQSSPPLPHLRRRGFRLFGLLVISSLTLFFVTDLSLLVHRRPPPKLPPLAYQVNAPPVKNYNTATCARLDMPFEFESPPDFTKLGIESWTDCRRVRAKDGWTVEHCTAPGSTWLDPDPQESLDTMNNDNNHQFLFRPQPKPKRQPYLFMSPPRPRSIYPDLPPLSDSTRRDRPSNCNPSGYFRIRRISAPSGNYTLGSSHPDPKLRCRNDPRNPIALDQATRTYAENFAGPDTFRVILDGPEHYVTNQQINLGDCTYAVPYVLSRPGKFWLAQIEHGHEDFSGLVENFDEDYVSTWKGDFILPEIGEAPGPDAGFEHYRAYKASIAEMYEFLVCTGCPQFLNPASQPKYEDWPICSHEPSSGAREYGIYAHKTPAQQFSDLAKRDFEWIAARPSCRYFPLLHHFETLETIESSVVETDSSEAATLSSTPLYGAPPSAPATVQQFKAEQAKAQECLARNRSIYFVGDSHIRNLLAGLSKRVRGIDGDLQVFKDWSTHTEQLGGVVIRQDFDQWFALNNFRIQYMLGDDYIPFSPNYEKSEDELDLLERYDTIVVDFGAWFAAGYGVGRMRTAVEFLDFFKKVFWGLAKIRAQRQDYFKETGLGYKDLSIIWMGNIPWPDMPRSWSADMRSNTRFQYWDDLTMLEIAKINEHYKDRGGMIDQLDAFSKLLPHRKLSPDTLHHLAKPSVDVITQVLLHKLNLCPFTPTFPPLTPRAPFPLS
ncbi:hypothetical protein BGZ83_000885 [Gryganskiella cystojenkinii]|nr:hypothetical protein BGZ83_000885 [Gryganskiella cystojenkinii]